MKIAICEDNKKLADDLLKQIKSYPFDEHLEVNSFQSGRELLRELSEQSKYDVIFMDIQLENGENGITIAAAIKSLYPEILVIYGSAYNYYESLANAEPFLFLPKPVTKEDIYKALDKVLDRLKKTTRKYFHFTHNGEIHKIDINQILYVESAYKKITVKTHKEEFEFWGQLGPVYEEMNRKYPYFMQISKSIIVNYIYVDVFKKSELIINGETLPVARAFEKECREKERAFAKELFSENEK